MQIQDPTITLVDEDGKEIPILSLQTDTITSDSTEIEEGKYTLNVYLTDGKQEVNYSFPDISIGKSSEGISNIDFTKITQEVQTCLGIIAMYHTHGSVDILHDTFSPESRTKFGKPDSVNQKFIKPAFVIVMVLFVLGVIWWGFFKPTNYDAKYVAYLNIQERSNNTSIVIEGMEDYTLLTQGQDLFNTNNTASDNVILSLKEKIVALKVRIMLFMETRIGRIEKLGFEIKAQELAIQSRVKELGVASSEVSRLESVKTKNIVSTQELESARQRKDSIGLDIDSMKSFLQAMKVGMKNLENGLLLSSNDFSDGMKIPLDIDVEQAIVQNLQLIQLRASLAKLVGDKRLVSWCNDCYYVRDYFFTNDDNTLRLLNNKQYVVFAAKTDQSSNLVYAEAEVDGKKGTVIKMLPRDQNQFIGFISDEFYGFRLSLFLVELHDQTYSYDDGKGKLSLFAEPTSVTVYKN